MRCTTPRPIFHRHAPELGCSRRIVADAVFDAGCSTLHGLLRKQEGWLGLTHIGSAADRAEIPAGMANDLDHRLLQFVEVERVGIAEAEGWLAVPELQTEDSLVPIFVKGDAEGQTWWPCTLASRRATSAGSSNHTVGFLQWRL